MVGVEEFTVNGDGIRHGRGGKAEDAGMEVMESAATKGRCCGASSRGGPR